jgi:competence protein ComEA
MSTTSGIGRYAAQAWIMPLAYTKWLPIFLLEKNMLKKVLLAAAFCLSAVFAHAADVEINKADQPTLDSVKGIGPSLSSAIVEERKKGEFKDWADLEKRVKGVKEKKAMKLSDAGLRVNGQALQASPGSQGAAAKASKKDEAKK